MMNAFSISVDDNSFDHSTLTFVVTATLSDEAATSNSDLVVTVMVVKP